MPKRNSQAAKPDPRIQSLMQQVLREDHAFEVIRSRADRQLLHIDAASWGGAIDLFVKIYQHATWNSRLKARLALSGGIYDFRVCRRLADAGLPVPPPFGGMYRAKRRHAPCKTLFAQQWIKGSRPLSETMRMKSEAGRVDPVWVEEVLNRIGELIALMHLHGFLPRDWHPGNLVLQETATGHPQIMLIDYESIRQRRFTLKNRVHLSLGQICSYMNDFAPRAHELLAESYRRAWPHRTPPDFAGRIQRVAREHSNSRRLRVEKAFAMIGAYRWKNKNT